MFLAPLHGYSLFCCETVLGICSPGSFTTELLLHDIPLGSRIVGFEGFSILLDDGVALFQGIEKEDEQEYWVVAVEIIDDLPDHAVGQQQAAAFSNAWKASD